jgi:M6 family metalloprotease-like protein
MGTQNKCVNFMLDPLMQLIYYTTDVLHGKLAVRSTGKEPTMRTPKVSATAKPRPGAGLSARKPPPARVAITVKIGMPRRPLFVGSFHRLPVRITGRLAFNDIAFSVPDGPPAGLISPSRDRTWNPARPHIILLVGFRPGTYLLEARRLSNNALLFQGKFEVNALWPDEDAGPGLWFTGADSPPYFAGSAWGGGSSGPQNVNVRPALGTRRVAVLLVDTSDQRFSTDAPTVQGFRDRWMNELINGVTDGGVTRSVRTYYREVSNNRFDISAQVFGPVQLPGQWSDYFVMDSGGNWAPGGALAQACVTAGDGPIDFTQFDTLACISQQVDALADGTAQRRAWPYAFGGTYATAEGSRALGIISMPNEWGVVGNREIFDTFSHELAHNLGLPDLYTPAVAGRNMGNWELMHGDDALPHLTIAHKAMLGWVDAGWIRSFDFQALGGNVDQSVTLHPAEAGAPAANRLSAVEVRIADGWNYYFEYRLGQAAQIGDRALPEDGVVLGTDVISPPYIAPFSRPAILLLPPDTDAQGAALSNGEDYRENDFSDPTWPADFRVDVSGIDAAKADLRIRYGVLGKPDPLIRPWPAAPDRQWQSPDIEVQNARNAADPAWRNVPWVGNANTVVASVLNNGQVDAPQVRVNFYVKNYNAGGAPASFLGSDVRDVAAGATVAFSTNWVPPATGHFCIEVRIPLYQTPTTPPAIPVVEQTELNNIAQSNYDRFISSTSIPSREMTTVTVGNPYPARTRVFLWPGQTNPLYRTYLQHTFLTLDPGETREVAMMFEFAPDNLSNKVLPDRTLREARKMLRVPNEVGTTAWVEDPNDTPRHKVDLLGGAQMQVVTGRSTKFQRFSTDGPRAVGLVVDAEGGQPAAGSVVVRVTRDEKDPAKQFEYTKAKLGQGQFAVPFRMEGAREVQAFFVPAPGWADSASEVVRLSKRGRG